MVPSNPSVGPSTRTTITFILPKCTDELLSTPKITTFLPQSKPEYKKSEHESNPIPYPE